MVLGDNISIRESTRVDSRSPFSRIDRGSIGPIFGERLVPLSATKCIGNSPALLNIGNLVRIDSCTAVACGFCYYLRINVFVKKTSSSGSAEGMIGFFA